MTRWPAARSSAARLFNGSNGGSSMLRMRRGTRLDTSGLLWRAFAEHVMIPRDMLTPGIRHRIASIGRVAVVAAGLLLAPHAAHAQASYSIKDLGTFGGLSKMTAISDKGHL